MEHFPCDQTKECPLRDSRRGCFEDVHHLYFPRNRYRSGVAKAFRELPENKELTCRARHNELHATQEPLEQPSVEEMRDAIYQSRVGRLALDGETEMAG